MIWCRFEAGAGATYGVLEGDTLHAVAGTPFGGDSRTTGARTRRQR